MANPFRGMEHLTAPECPGFYQVVQLVRDAKKDASAASELSALLKKFEPATLRLCKNVPYAAHGRPFASKKLRRHFYGGKPERGRFGWDSSMRIRQGMRENPEYSRGLLTNDELSYVKALKRGG
jgi:hypothetical protein